MKTNGESSEFSSIDHSVSAPLLRGYVSQKVIIYLPEALSPTTLTSLGCVFGLCAALLLWLLALSLFSSLILEKAIVLLSALFLVTYAVCDQLDGMQARRRSLGGAAGDFLDHWVDCLIVNVVPPPLMFYMGYDVQVVLFVMFVTAFTWWANNWETSVKKRRVLPSLGGLEYILVGIISLVLSALFGNSFWSAEVYSIAVREALLVLVVTTMFYSFMRSLIRACHHWKDIVSPLVSLACVYVWILLSSDSQHDVTLQLIGSVVFAGLLATKSTGDMIVKLWLGLIPGEIKSSVPLPTIGVALLCTIWIVPDASSHLRDVLILSILGYLVLLLIRQITYSLNKLE